jgi:hypothetical protein
MSIQTINRDSTLLALFLALGYLFVSAVLCIGNTPNSGRATKTRLYLILPRIVTVDRQLYRFNVDVFLFLPPLSMVAPAQLCPDQCLKDKTTVCSVPDDGEMIKKKRNVVQHIMMKAKWRMIIP